MHLVLRTYLLFAARLGLEPRLTGPEPVVLPLDDLAINTNYKITMTLATFYKSNFCFKKANPPCTPPIEPSSAILISGNSG